MNKKIWVDPEILQWPLAKAYWSEAKLSHLERAYQIWEHAEKKANLDNINEFDRVDIITTLKRCLNQRLKCIEREYKFKIFFNSPKSYLQLLELLGIIRPLLLKKLLELRNLIEHNDKKPPNMNRCKELVDIVWYFLKTTDFILLHIPTYLELESPNPDEFFRIETIRKRKWSILVKGDIPLELVSKEKKEDFFEMLLDGHQRNSQIQPGQTEDSSIYVRGTISDIPNKIFFVKRLLSYSLFTT